MSIAQAKLERQRRRNEEAEAALNAPLSLDRRAQTSRGVKGKQWKPFDFTADSTPSTMPNEGGVPVSEVRVNTFPAPSRASSLSRPMSVLSSHASESATSDMLRQDSGFQVIGKGGRNRKNVGELSAYEGKPEERQTTVEASFDRREIYDLFGNALPGPEFIEQNVGFKNGQLQFLQHPNGDVSAQQWSTERYLWENIGQFSNIRKKVEGQLASDRLKGETAHQTLQQNTLAYFRTIARQREANVMGLPFGPKEIQALLPEPRGELAAAPTGLKEPLAAAVELVDTKPEAPAWNRAASEQPTARPSNTSQSQQNVPWNSTPFVPNVMWQPMEKHYQSSTPLGQAQFSQPPPQGPRADGYNYGSGYGQHATRQEDPFFSGVPYQQFFQGYPYDPYYGQAARALTAGPLLGTPQRPQGLNYNFHFPQAMNRVSQDVGGQAYFGANKGVTNDPTRQWRQTFGSQMTPAGGTGYARTVASGSQNTTIEGRGHHATPGYEIVAPTPTQPTPTNTHNTAMLDQLWKVADTAKERSQSQGKIRTVLYDPFQSQQSAVKTEPEKQPEKQDVPPPVFSKQVQGKTLQPPSTFDATSSSFFPTVLAPSLQVGRSSSPIGGVIEHNLRESSPDTQWSKRPVDHSAPVISALSESKPTPQRLSGVLVANDTSAYDSVTTSTHAARNAYDDELNQWWTSGNLFARQEEFYQSIKTAHQSSVNNKPTTTPAHLTPIGPPSRNTPSKTLQKTPASFNETTTRLLVPVLENLASYVQGPPEKRRDYFSQWSHPPEWCIDRSEGGNDSFIDSGDFDWGQLPARVGRDPRYSNDRRQWSGGRRMDGRAGFGGGGSLAVGSGYGRGSLAVGSGIDRGFNFGGRR